MVAGIARLLLQGAGRYGDDVLRATRDVYQKNPYVKNYLDMMTGQQGWKKGAAAWYGTDYAMDTMSDLMLPEERKKM